MAKGGSKGLRVKKILKEKTVGIREPKCSANHFSKKYNYDDEFVIVIMTYKRVRKLEKILNFLSNFGKGGHLLLDYNIHVVITQSCDEDAPETVSAVEDLLKRFENTKDTTPPFRSIKHVKVPLMKHDDSFSTNKKMYGNKRNSLQNLKNGLSVALATHPGVEDLFVLEDDAIISCDVFEIIKFLRTNIIRWGDHPVERGNSNHFNENKNDKKVGLLDNKNDDQTELSLNHPKNNIGAFALDSLFRPSLYVGNFMEEIGERIAPSNEQRINMIYVNPRTVIKTFAYVLKRKLALEYVEALDMIDTDADNFDQGGFFYNCNFCEPYCYDHVLEWMLQNKYLLVPDIPRTTQLAGKGMTYKENPVTPIYQYAVKEDKFYISKYKHLGVSYFPIIGTSALTRERSYFNLATQTTSQLWFWLLFIFVSFIVCCLKCLNSSRNEVNRKWGSKKRS